jgi:hypothetical protein
MHKRSLPHLTWLVCKAAAALDILEHGGGGGGMGLHSSTFQLNLSGF